MILVIIIQKDKLFVLFIWLQFIKRIFPFKINIKKIVSFSFNICTFIKVAPYCFLNRGKKANFNLKNTHEYFGKE